MNKNVIVSGMRPTGRLHLGHYFGVLKNWIELQHQYDSYFFVADWHSLTTEYNNVAVVKQTMNDMVIDWLASGVDPNKATLFVQSWVPEHAELHLLLSMITPLGWLERVPSYKELQQELKNKDLSTYGFLGYPLLQTADVALYKANSVPVGQDQVAHIELSREILRRFNHLYGDLFPEPKALLTKVPKVVGTDGRKMSKSYDNCIYLSDTLEEMNEKLKRHITDPARKLRSDPGNPKICPVFTYHSLVSSKEENQEITKGCTSASIGCIDCKKILMKNLEESLEEFRQKRQYYKERPKEVTDILKAGSEKASKIASQTLLEVKQVMGLEG